MIHTFIGPFLSSYASRKLGYELAQRYGAVPVIISCVILYGITHIVFRALGGRTEQEVRDGQAEEQEEADHRSATGDGPPRFNG